MARTSAPTKKVSAVLKKAHRADLLDGEKTGHASFHGPNTLTTPDPVANFLKMTRGKLGRDHQLDY